MSYNLDDFNGYLVSKVMFVNKDTGEELTQIDGVSFDNIVAGWESKYKVAIKNCTDKELEVFSGAWYPKEDIKSATLAEWLAVQVVVGEDRKRIGEATFKTWKYKPFKFVMKPHEIVEVEFRFYCFTLPEDLKGATGQFDFEFGVKEEEQ